MERPGCQNVQVSDHPTTQSVAAASELRSDAQGRALCHFHFAVPGREEKQADPGCAPSTLQAAIDDTWHIPCAVNNGHDLDWFLCEVDDKIRPNGPESERRHRQIFAYMPQFRVVCQQAEGSEETHHQAQCGFRTLLGDVIADLPEVVFHIPAKEESTHSALGRRWC